MATNEEIYKVKHIPMELVLNDLGLKRDKRGFYECPYHTEDTPSGKITPKSNLFYCFGCSTQRNNIELVMDLKGLPFPQAVAYLQQLDGAIPSMVKESLPRQAAKSSDEIYREALAKYRPYDPQMRKSAKKRILEHLEERGLTNAMDILKSNKYGIGHIDGNIAYNLNGFFVVRYPHNKANLGSPKFSYLTVNKADPTLYICEGITDALAAAEMGYNSIVLHSVNNVPRLIERFKVSPKAKDYNYVIATDNDEMGLKAKHQLEVFFKEYNFNYKDYEALRASKYKDLGDFYKMDCQP